MGKGSLVLRKTLDCLRDQYAQKSLRSCTLARVGLKMGWNTVIGSDGRCGMAMAFSNWDTAFGKQIINLAQVQAWIGRDLFAVADEYIGRTSWHERAIGVAALSALSQPLLLPASLRQRGFDVPDQPIDFAGSVRENDVVAVVGYGGGVKRLLGKCREIHVSDMRPRPAFQTLVIDKDIHFSPSEIVVHSEKENPAMLRAATAVAITGSTLVNGTFETLMQHSAHARLVSLYGASASMIPDVLFECGVNLIQTYRMADPAAFEDGMMNDINMEAAIQRTQQMLTIRRGIA